MLLCLEWNEGSQLKLLGRLSCNVMRNASRDYLCLFDALMKLNSHSSLMAFHSSPGDYCNMSSFLVIYSTLSPSGTHRYPHAVDKLM